MASSIRRSPMPTSITPSDAMVSSSWFCAVTPVKTPVNFLGTETLSTSARATDLRSPHPSSYGTSAVVTLGENQITGVRGIGWELTGSVPRLCMEQPAADSVSASPTQRTTRERHRGKRTIGIEWSVFTLWLYRIRSGVTTWEDA